ncbi:MAG: radical SAM protein [Acidobacteriia bacterium]|nr:radical SAM protein [Terriglobia bacterium]
MSGLFPILRNPPVEPSWSITPEVVGIEITGRCQLSCRHCFNSSGPDNVAELPLAVLERIFDQAASWGVRSVRLSGGEPTIHRDFRAVVDACAGCGLGIALNTHGVYSRDILEYLKTAAIDQFLVSVDGLEENNDAIRGHGLFRRAVDSCRELHAAGRPVMMSCHLGECNAADASGLIRLAAEIGVDVKFSPIRPIGRAIRKLPGVMIRPETYLTVVERIARLRSVHSATKILIDFDILDDAVPDGACQRASQMSSCKAGRTMININYDGGVYPCPFFVTPEQEFSAGNVQRDDLLDVWRNSPVFAPFRKHRKSELCQDCSHYRRSCAGGCPAIAYFATGYLDGHDPTCFWAAMETGRNAV